MYVKLVMPFVSTSDIFFTPGFRLSRKTYLGHSILVAESKGLSKGSQNLTMALTFPPSCDHTPWPLTFHWPEQVSWQTRVPRDTLQFTRQLMSKWSFFNREA